MSAALRLYTAPSGGLLAALRDGQSATGPWGAALPDPGATAARVAAAVGAGGRHLDVDAALHVVATVTSIGSLVATLGYAPAGGEHVRDRLVGRVLAERIGDEAVTRLFLGPVAGCTFPELPSVGLLGPLDLGLALTRATAVRDRDLDDAEARVVRSIRAALERAAIARHDLVGVLA